MRSRKYIFINSTKSASKAFSRKFAFRTISRNQHLDLFFRYFSYYNYSSFVQASAYVTRAKAICFFTGRSRGLLSKFFISRLTFKEHTINGHIFGYKRAQW